MNPCDRWWYGALNWLFESWGAFECEAGTHTWAPLVFALGCAGVFLAWYWWACGVALDELEEVKHDADK